MDGINDRPDMTSAVYRGRKASTQTNKTCFVRFIFSMELLSKGWSQERDYLAFNNRSPYDDIKDRICKE